MRIDREAFLLAVSALAGCERADSLQPPPPGRVAATPRPAVAAMVTPEPVVPVARPAPEPIAAPQPTPEPPKPKRRAVSPAKRWFLGLSMEQRDNVKGYCVEAAQSACREALRGMPAADADADADVETPEDRYLAGLSSGERQTASAYCREIPNLVAPHYETPLVVAFDSQPVD